MNIVANGYCPDVWVIIELTGTEVPETYCRVLAGWYGGFASGDSWKASSGITAVVDMDSYWEIHNVSGSIYNCNKNTEKLSMYTASIFNELIKQNCEQVSVRELPIAEFLQNPTLVAEEI